MDETELLSKLDAIEVGMAAAKYGLHCELALL
jgi:hypothetical protein